MSRSNRLVLLAFATFIMLSFPEAMLGVAWPFMRTTFGVSLDALGVLLVAATAGHTTLSFGGSLLSERLGIGRALLLGNGLRIVAWAGYFLTPAWWGMVGFAFVGGAGAALLDVGLNAYFAAHHSPRTMNWLHANFGLGATLGPIVMTAVLERGQSWRLGYAVAIGLQALVLAGYVASRRHWRVDGGTAMADEPATAAAPALDSRWLVVALGLALFFMISGVEATAGNWAFTLFTEGRGIAVALAGTWVSIYWGSFTAGRILFGLLANRLRSASLIRANLAVILAGAALLWWRPTDLISFLGLALIGFGLAPIFPLLVLETPRRVGRARATRVIGYQIGSAGLGLALLPALAGVLAARLNLEVIGPFLVAAAGLLIVLHELLLARQRPLPVAVQQQTFS